MNKLSLWAEIGLSSMRSFFENFMEVLPNIIGAVLIIILGWLTARLFTYILKKILRTIKLDDRILKLNKQNAVLESERFKNIKPSEIISKFFYWILILIVFIMAFDILGWESVSFEISKLISFLPKLFIAIIIFIIGYYIAVLTKSFIISTFLTLGVDLGKVIGAVAYYVILIIMTVTSVNQLGINTSIITSNIIIIFGAIALTLALSFGISSKDFLINILSSSYGKSQFKPGMIIKIGDTKGEILSISKVYLVIKTKTGKVVYPAQILTKEKIEIIDNN